MSAMLTYFDFMLQKDRYGRKDSAEKRYPDYIKQASDRHLRQSYRVLPDDAKCWK
jgi:hypothetical protein